MNRKQLLDALTFCKAATDPRSPMAPFKNVLLADNTASAMDGVVSAIAPIDYDGAPIAIECHRLLSAVKALDSEQVRIKLHKDSKVEVFGGVARKFTLPIWDAADMPAFPSRNGGTAHEIATADMLRHLDAVAHSVSRDKTRQHLNSALVDLTGAGAVATDGHRLALSGTLGEHRALLSLRAIPLFRAALESSETATLTVNGNRLFCRAGDVEVSALVPDATFPPYQQVIPEGRDNHVAVDSAALASAVAAVATVASDRTSGVLLTFGDGKIALSRESPEKGAATDFVECDATEEHKVGVSAAYMLDALKVVGETARISVDGDLDPVLIDGAVTCVVMPMRIG